MPGKPAIRKPLRYCSPRTYSSTQCAEGRRRGPGCGSTCSTCRLRSGRLKSIWNRRSRRSAAGAARPENLLELVRRRNFELVVSAFVRRLVGPPPQKRRGVPEPIALQVVVLHFADPLDAERLPRQILAGAPAALPARHPLSGSLRLGPLAPRMRLQRVLPQRLQLFDERLACSHRERGSHADVVQPAFVVVETQEQRADGVRAALVPSETGDDAVGGARVLYLEHRALAGHVRLIVRLCNDTIEPCAFEPLQPLGRQFSIASDRCEIHGRCDVPKQAFERAAAIGLWTVQQGF